MELHSGTLYCRAYYTVDWRSIELGHVLGQLHWTGSEVKRVIDRSRGRESHPVCCLSFDWKVPCVKLLIIYYIRFFDITLYDHHHFSSKCILNLFSRNRLLWCSNYFHLIKLLFFRNYISQEKKCTHWRKRKSVKIRYNK